MPAKPPFKFVDQITSDVMFEAYGRDKQELFVHAALAVANVLCKVDQVKPRIEKEIRVEADSLDDLLVNWLHAIISRADIDEMFFSKFTIIELSDTHLRAFVYGEPISAKKGNTVVKAVTYYGFKLQKTTDGWMCRVSLDI